MVHIPRQIVKERNLHENCLLTLNYLTDVVPILIVMGDALRRDFLKEGVQNQLAAMQQLWERKVRI